QALRNIAPEGVQNDFVAMAALIGEAHRLDFNPTACGAAGVNGSSARQVLQTQQFFNEQIYLHPQITIPEPTEDAPSILAKAVALAYPDRLAARRDLGTHTCEMRDGRVGELAAESTVRKADFLVAANVRETKTGGTQKKKALLSFVCEIKREWLHELFPDRWQTENVLVWNNQKLCVEGREQTRCLGVLIDEKKHAQLDRQAAGKLLAQNILSRRLRLEGWSDAQSLIGRIKKAAHQHPHAGFPPFNQQQRDEIVYRLCDGHVAYQKVKTTPIVPIVEQMLTDEQRKLMAEAGS
ncbi:MAG: hypothetical protein ACOCW2_01520, partial [Chitinivibrionales bacterium]